MGRPRERKAGTPTTLSFRIDEQMSKDIDAEVEQMRAEGWSLTLTDVVRKLLREALDVRRAKRGK
jgi:hypothetical protein